MIIFFGPAGAGKSVQGQMLGARHGWTWLSTGQMFRESKDKEVQEILKTGELISDDKTIEVVDKALGKVAGKGRIIIDGFPRTMKQAEWLVEHQSDIGQTVKTVIVLEVPESVIQERLKLRGREQDKPDIIARRMNIYRREMYPVLAYFAHQGIKVVHIDGNGSVGEVHDRIQAELSASELINAAP